jgi:sulfide dehydrogenase [flavocytochrome c] flavoprotein subunit
MSSLNRRQFLKIASAVAAATPLLGAKNTMAANAQPHVVVVGGGVGGATFAKYLRMYDANVKVTIIQDEKDYQRRYGSSEVIVDHIPDSALNISYDDLKSKYGVEFLFDTVVGIDFDKRQVSTQGGVKMAYDRLLLSPGITFDYSSIPGMTEEIANTQIPHGWNAGSQLVLLKKQLEAVPVNGKVIIVPPPQPFRCPPGPYERAGLITQWLLDRGDKNPTVTILDINNDFPGDYNMVHVWNRFFGMNVPKDFEPFTKVKYTPEQMATLKVYKEPAKLQWITSSEGGRVLKVDAATKTVEAEAGTFKADMINIIPPLKAGKIAIDMGLTDSSGWCPVDAKTFESTIHPFVHVIGDSSAADPMPKSGYSANNQAKMVALQIKSLLAGKGPIEPIEMQNTCYVAAGPDEFAIFVTEFFRESQGKIIEGVQPPLLPFNATDEVYRLCHVYQESWIENFTKDCFS